MNGYDDIFTNILITSILNDNIADVNQVVHLHTIMNL